MNLQINADSAGCCGIRHIGRFGSSVGRSGSTNERIVKLIQDHVNGDGLLYTISLTNNQLRSRSGEVMKLLMKEGWVLVTRFRNPNSDNIVNVFHYSRDLRTTRCQQLGLKAPANQG